MAWLTLCRARASCTREKAAHILASSRASSQATRRPRPEEGPSIFQQHRHELRITSGQASASGAPRAPSAPRALNTSLSLSLRLTARLYGVCSQAAAFWQSLSSQQQRQQRQAGEWALYSRKGARTRPLWPHRRFYALGRFGRYLLGACTVRERAIVARRELGRASLGASAIVCPSFPSLRMWSGYI